MIENSVEQSNVTILICPGVHSPQLTDSFLQGLGQDNQAFGRNWLIFPTADYPAYSALDILVFLRQHTSDSAILIIGFSAGVVGAMGAATLWQQFGRVQGFIALDGWGVPLAGNFPIHRLSHDYFTHWSSALLGAGADSFYAEPSVEHLELWRSPYTTLGWWTLSSGNRIRCSAADFLIALIKRYQE